MSHNQSLVENLIQGLQFKDPKLYDALKLISRDVSKALEDLEPIVTANTLAAATVAPTPTPTGFTATLSPTAITFAWLSNSSIALFELRKGTVWETATFVVKTPSLGAILSPIVAGSHTYLLKGINTAGIYSTSSVSVVFVVAAPAAVIITSKVIDNNVLLNWNIPASTFQVDYYELYKTNTLTGRVRGTFIPFFESLGGTFTYKIIAYDIAGNAGVASEIQVIVTAPPDYVLYSTVNSVLGGTKVNVILQNINRLLCCIDLAETFQNHFDTRTWASPQAQVDAGFPLYIEPTLLTGSYEEVIDYGVVLNNVIVNVDWQISIIVGGVTILVRMASSTDNITYTAFTNGQSQYISTLRYLKLRLEFTGTDNKSLIELYTVQVFLDVKREVDSGQVTAVSTDVGGTVVLFTKPFKDVDSITVTVDSNEPVYPMYDFTDIPSPTQFKVLAFDSGGNRINFLVSWKARGVV